MQEANYAFELNVRLFSSFATLLDPSAVPSDEPVLTLPPAELEAAYKGDLGTLYYPGYYDLAEDEVLVIERPAVACATWSVSCYTHWLEPLPPPHADLGRIDDRGAATAPGEAVTIRLAPSTEGLTGPTLATGRRRGAMLYRTIDGDELAIPRTRIERR